MDAEPRSSASVRPYRQRARAEAAARTRAAILDATVSLVLEKATSELSLADVGSRAGVSVQTVLRHFGTREGLLDAALAHGSSLIEAERRIPSTDVRAAVGVLLEHYERRGDSVIRLLAQEAFDERIAQITSRGKQVHREWVTDLVARAEPACRRDEVVDQLVVVTDVYAWKLLRRDRGLSRQTAESRINDLVGAVLAAAEQRAESEDEETS
jgi:AcrR family transcriptional regulator